MGQSNSRYKHPFPFNPQPAGYYGAPYPNPMPQYGQYGMVQPVQPMNQHVVVPYTYMPQPQPYNSHSTRRRKKKRRDGSSSSMRRRNTGPTYRAGSARFDDSTNQGSNHIRRAQTPFHHSAHLEEEEEEQEEMEEDGFDAPEEFGGSRRHRSTHHVSQSVPGPSLPPPPEMKMLSPHPPNPLPLPPRDIFESAEYKAVMRGPVGTSALLATMYPPKDEVRDVEPQRSKTGFFGKRSSKGGLFRSLTGTKKKKEESPRPDITVGNGIRLLPIPVGVSDYHKLSTPTASGATTAGAEPVFPHPPPGVTNPAQAPAAPFLMAGAGPNHLAQPPAPTTPTPSESTEPLYFNQTHPDYGGFLPHSHHRIEYGGHIYKSATHLHEALKYPEHPHIAESIRACTTLSDIFHIATSNADRARPDWPGKFVEVMEWVMMKKFEQHPNLRALLLLTGNRPLVYSEEKDPFWGDGVGMDVDGVRRTVAGMQEGANELGQMLMRIRERIRTQSPDPFQQQ
ncbi:hypothetical protein D9758_013417 [Tetrapyrgos nigripes]|uniref:NADAR domain-containing protein n=1 Tax=Tetrapyrgos nigripes TaxID=182062 RepID=A0A8H5CK49_9AGAR|nr:hypothetical protein D9758_013417 [Tetrapyrgos nigripes]